MDKGFSGTTCKNRTGLDNALAAVTSAAAAVADRQVVLTTTKFDRFARNMAEAGEILTNLRERDVLFGLGSSIYDWNDPFGMVVILPVRSESSQVRSQPNRGQSPFPMLAVMP
ncbi:recombinase family protein [Nocardia sp. FBN12]|uniref:recombinase family protein n=1 Tax=Nocardia sp. FBN12 TaxID=3419766 RepID=UPI003D01AF3A